MEPQAKRDHVVSESCFEAPWPMDAPRPESFVPVARVEDLLDQGSQCHSKGHFDEALRAYQEVMELDPHNACAHFLSGLALRAQGREDEARHEWGLALRVQGMSKNHLWARTMAKKLLINFV